MLSKKKKKKNTRISSKLGLLTLVLLGTFGVFGVINSEVGDDKGIFKVTNGFPGPVTNEAVAKITHTHARVRHAARNTSC